jgi:acetyl esterase/lipase
MSRNLIDRLNPEIKGPVQEMLKQSPPAVLDDIPATRAASKKARQAMKAQAPVIPGVTSEDRTIPGPQGAPEVAVRIYHPENQPGPLPALLWFHGGGYVLGDIDLDDSLCKEFTIAGKCVTVSVEYRLAPENPFPAPLDDGYSALKWLAESADELGVDRSRIAVGGASAGGGLASALALLARDRAEVKVHFQLLMFPMLDDSNVYPQ